VHGLAGPDSHCAYRHVFDGYPRNPDALPEGDEPQQFLDGTRKPGRIGPRPGQLPRVSEQRAGDVADLINARVVSADQHQEPQVRGRADPRCSARNGALRAAAMSRSMAGRVSWSCVPSKIVKV
jgi:hypothetical protein